MERPLRTEKIGKVTIELHLDSDPLNPRKEWDNVGTMLCWYRRYDLGDEHNFCDGHAALLELLKEHGTPTEKRKFVIKACAKKLERLRFIKETCGDNLDYMVEKADECYRSVSGEEMPDSLLVLPLRVYEHSGITMSTGSAYPFNDSFDSSSVGFIYVTPERAHREWGIDANTEEGRKEALKRLKQEVETYDEYLTGMVYGYVIKAPPIRESEAEEGREDTVHDSCWGFYGGEEYCLEEARHIAKRLNDDLTRQQELPLGM